MTKDKHTFRVKRLIVFSALAAIILAVTTYAWFIGMRTVNVTDFEVEIAVADDLLLSLDGANWDTTLKIDKTTIENIYPDSTNSWGGKGLVPMSSIGEMDITASRMKLFEKASLTSTPGGYRLMASRIDNYSEGVAEQDGYVVFDLFIRNFTGSEYIADPNKDDEEAIYLTVDSEVTIPNDGVKDTGIENSVRVAFTQIGRVNGTTTDQSIITGITCETTKDSEGNTIVTGLCRNATIWEPNDTDHVQNAINWYETSCLKRTGSDVRDPDSYDGDCEKVVDGLAYPTYAVSKEIKSSDNVNVYDGPAYNTYSESSSFLVDHPYFTDSDKLLKGTSRPEFMSLAPNSITKLRIYVYIEGQDVDNYDFASIGKKISVKFGFTKQQLTEEDINYEGEDVNQGEGPEGNDLTAPRITLTGDKVIELTVGTEYEELGATAVDNIDGDLSEEIKIESRVNTDQVGEYYVIYRVTDTAGNLAVETRTVKVVAAQP
jgi:hypothetical protein